MRKMKRSDVREWTLGETLERVNFGHGCTGMDKSIPKEPGQEGDFKRLIWKCRAIEADGGPSIEVLPSEYWIGDMKQGGYVDVVAGASSSGPFRFDDAWTYLNGIEEGWRLAGGERHSGLYEVLRTLRNGIFGSSAHRHKNSTGPGPLMAYSMVSDGTKSSGSCVFSRNAAAHAGGVTDSTCTSRDPSTRTRRTAPRTHSTSENGGLS
jgi:hypothetical protein